MVWHVFCDPFGLYPNYVVQNLEFYCPNQQYLCINTFPEQKLSNNKIICLQHSISSQKEFIRNCSKAPTKVIFHAYQQSLYHFLYYLKKKYPDCEIKWLFWSFELYNLPSNYPNLLEPYSLHKYNKTGSLIRYIRRFLLRRLPHSMIDLACYILNYPYCSESRFIKSFSHITSFISLLKHDYHYLRKNYPATHIQHEFGAYLSLERIIPNDKDILSSPKNHWIMIGHSAALEGNQYEIISLLKEWNLEQTILVPLAYGNENYKNDIADYARASFKTPIILESKIETKEYYELLQNVSYVILNTKIQQGIGNLTALLWYGAKVFLREESSTYLDFKEWGLHVFSIEKDLNKEALQTKLSLEEIKINRRILNDKLGEHSLCKIWQTI